MAISTRLHSEFDPVHLWAFGLERYSWLVSFLGLAVGGYAIVFIHESIHALSLYLLGGKSVTFTIDGIAPRAFDRTTLFSKRAVFVVTVMPFLLISLVGTAALLFVADRSVSWVFLPTVINAVVAAADFVVVAWLIGVPAGSVVAVAPEGCVAYARDKG